MIGKQQFDSSYNLNRDFTGATSPYYWLASPFADADDTYVFLGLLSVHDGCISGYYLCNSSGYTSPYYYGVRPVVSLQSGIQLEWNSTDKEWKIQ